MMQVCNHTFQQQHLPPLFSHRVSTRMIKALRLMWMVLGDEEGRMHQPIILHCFSTFGDPFNGKTLFITGSSLCSFTQLTIIWKLKEPSLLSAFYTHCQTCEMVHCFLKLKYYIVN